MKADVMPMNIIEPPSRRLRLKPRLQRIPFVRLIVRSLSLITFLWLWQIASDQRTHFIINFAHVPAPTAVASAAVEFSQSPKAFRHITSSIRRVFTGFSLAAIIAIPLGLVIGSSQWAKTALFTPLEILRPIPGVAWIPLAILMFVTSEQSMIFICFLGAFFPILLSSIHGVDSMDKKLIYASQTLGAKKLTIFHEVILQGAMPSIINGLTIGMGTCWLLVVTAEMVAGQFGIGYFTWESYTLQNYPAIVVGMLIIGMLGMISSAFVRLAGGKLMPWHHYATQSSR